MHYEALIVKFSASTLKLDANLRIRLHVSLGVTLHVNQSVKLHVIARERLHVAPFVALIASRAENRFST